MPKILRTRLEKGFFIKYLQKRTTIKNLSFKYLSYSNIRIILSKILLHAQPAFTRSKLTNRNIKTMCVICSKLKIKILEQRYGLPLTLNRFHTFCSVSANDFKQVNLAGCMVAAEWFCLLEALFLFDHRKCHSIFKQCQKCSFNQTLVFCYNATWPTLIYMIKLFQCVKVISVFFSIFDKQKVFKNCDYKLFTSSKKFF